MINSTAEGGGVAELLPAQISLLRQLGVDVRWAVIEAEAPEFFPFTKRLHNLIHTAPEPPPTPADASMYEAVNRSEAEALSAMVKDGDIVLVHDPQPLALGALLKKDRRIRAIWRCHIGVDEETEATRAAWEFLRPWAVQYDEVVFSVADYVPGFLRERARIIHPSIDPLSHKNRDLSLHKLVGILSDCDLVTPGWPLISPPFNHRARRLQSDGLPIESRKENALMVNALQSASDVVVQNSLREGFGLTAAEAMWKRAAVLGSATACGIRLQLRDGVDGRLVEDPEDVTALAALLAEMLGDSDRLEE